MDKEKEQKIDRVGKLLARYLPGFCGYVKLNYNQGRFENLNVYETRKPLPVAKQKKE
jgi:hypothetical protein